MLVTDAQVHVWTPGPDRHGAHGPEGFSPEAMIAAMNAVGVHRAVIVTLTADPDNEFPLEAARRYPNRLAVMGRIEYSDPAGPDRLKDWLKQPHMLGVRLTFLGQRMKLFDDGSYGWFWPLAEQYNIPVMCMALGTEMLNKVDALLTKHPGLIYIIDHLGSGAAEGQGNEKVRGPEAFEHIEVLEKLAKHERCYIKITSAPNFSAEPYPFADIKPFMKRIYEAFGPRRMLWGSDFTRLRGTYTARTLWDGDITRPIVGTYADCLRQVQEGLDFLSAEDKEWIMGKALSQVLNWPEGPEATK